MANLWESGRVFSNFAGRDQVRTGYTMSALDLRLDSAKHDTPGTPVTSGTASSELGYLHPLLQAPALMTFFVVCLGAQSALGTLGNLLVIGSFVIEKELRHTGNAFIVNLAIADLCITAVTTPSTIFGALYGESYFLHHRLQCAVVSTLCATGCLSSCWNMALIALNRCILICHYQHYNKIYTKLNTFLMCCAVWVIIYLIQMPNHIGWGDLRFSRQFFSCTFANHVHTYAIFYIMVGVQLPLFVCFVCYFRIYRRASISKLVRSRILSRQETSPNQATTVNVDECDILCPAPLVGDVSSCRKFYDQLVMIRVLFRVLIIYTIMWAPLVILILLHLEDSVSPIWYILVLLTAHGNSAINYLVYALSIDHFRRAYIRLLCFACFWKNRRSGRSVRESGSRGRPVTLGS